jgi:predicted SpoU family rRNA methylase
MAERVGMLRRVRQHFWSRYSLICEVQANEKALLKAFHQTHSMNLTVEMYGEEIDHLLEENSEMHAILSALGAEHVSRISHPSALEVEGDGE